MSDKTYQARYLISHEYPPEYVEHTKTDTLENAWLKVLHDEILQPGYPSRYYVINLRDEYQRVDYDKSEYRVSISVSQAQQKEVVMWAPPAYSEMAFKDVSYTALEEVGRRIKKLFRWRK
jgi:hypothetical protein